MNYRTITCRLNRGLDGTGGDYHGTSALETVGYDHGLLEGRFRLRYCLNTQQNKEPYNFSVFAGCERTIKEVCVEVYKSWAS